MLGELSVFEAELQRRHQDNHNVHNKVLEILFHLRGEHFIEPTGKRGRYRRA